MVDDNWEQHHHRHLCCCHGRDVLAIHGSTQKREIEGTARSIEVRIDGMNA